MKGASFKFLAGGQGITLTATDTITVYNSQPLKSQVWQGLSTHASSQGGMPCDVTINSSLQS